MTTTAELEIRIGSHEHGLIYQNPYFPDLGTYSDNVGLPWADSYHVFLWNPDSFSVTVDAIFIAGGERITY